MSDHLPECPMRPIAEAPVDFHRVFPDCICKALRACEKRVLDDDVLAAAYHGQAGYAAGVQAAREAVARLLPSPGDAPLIDLRDALAAIDALRAGDHSAPRQPEGYSPTATDNRP